MRAPDHASETEALTPASHPNLGAGLFTPHPTLSRCHLYTHPGSDRCATPLVPAARTLHPAEGAPLRRAPRPPARRREAAPTPRQSPLQSHVSSQRSAPDARPPTRQAGATTPRSGHAPALTRCPSPTRPLPPPARPPWHPALPRGRGGQQVTGEGHVFCDPGPFMMV